MQITLKILNAKGLERYIYDTMAERVNDATRLAIPSINYRFQNKIAEIIVNSPTYRSLVSGVLKAEFGLASPSALMANIIDLWKSEVSIKFDFFRIRGTSIKGRLMVGAIDASFSKVLSSNAASYFSHGYPVEWLSWLLKSGTASIIKGYEVEFGPKPKSRSGAGIMVRGSEYHVNPSFAGVPKDNFITKAMDAAQKDFGDIIVDEIERRI